MGSFSLMHWVVVLAVVVLVFGAGRIPRVMGDMAKGIRSFQSGLKADPEEDKPAPPARSDSAA